MFHGFAVQTHFLRILCLLFINTPHLCERLSLLALPFPRQCTTREGISEHCCVHICFLIGIGQTS